MGQIMWSTVRAHTGSKVHVLLEAKTCNSCFSSVEIDTIILAKPKAKRLSLLEVNTKDHTRNEAVETSSRAVIGIFYIPTNFTNYKEDSITPA